MDLELRPIVEEEFDRYRQAISVGFGGDAITDEEVRAGSLACSDLTRSRVVFDGDRIVGTSSSFGFEMSVPGGLVPTAGLTAVTVASTHRRRGLLTAMIEAHFDDAAARGEPVSSLWASETAIYGRFGYGSSMDVMTVSVDLTRAGVQHPEHPDEVRIIDLKEAETLLPPLHERLRRARPGTMSRSGPWWKHRHFVDHEKFRDGYSSTRYVVVTRDGGHVGFAAYRQKTKWSDELPQGEVEVLDLMGADERATASLWSYLCSIDLFTTVTTGASLPLDSELSWLTANPRAVTRKIGDGTWNRLIDVPSALEARRYRRAGELVISVDDRIRQENHGRYRLVVDETGAATCKREGDGLDPSAGPVVTASGLGALYLGSRSARPLRFAGLVSATDEELDAIDETFTWQPQAWCPDGF